MGTNYYAHVNVCEHCNKPEKIFHIGKSSCGWTFSFRGYREGYESPTETPLVSYIDWIKFLCRSNVIIRDEYDRFVDYKEFIDLVENKKDAKHNHTVYVKNDPSLASHSERCWIDQQGHSFSDCEFC